MSAPWSAGWSGRSGRSCRCSAVARLRPVDGDRGTGVPRRLRADQGRHEPRGRRARRSGRAEARAGRRLARRAAGPVHPHPGAGHGRWVVAANVLLGVNQGLTWSTTVLMKIDLVGPRNRGPRARPERGVRLPGGRRGRVPDRARSPKSAGLRPAPFFLGIAIAGLGTRRLGAVRPGDPRPRPARRARAGVGTGRTPRPGWLGLAWRSTIADRSLSAASQAGLVNNLNDALAWGLLPIVWLSAGLDLGQIGLLAAAYPATWGVVQIVTGALSDRIGRKRLIVAGMLVQAAAIAAIAASTGFGPWLAAAIALGSGPRWSTRRCWPSSPTSPNRDSAGRSPASTASGGTSASRSGRSSSGVARRPVRCAGGDPGRGGVDGRLGVRRRRPDARDATRAARLADLPRTPRRRVAGRTRRMSMPATGTAVGCPEPGLGSTIALTPRSRHPPKEPHRMEAFRIARPDIDDALDLDAFEADLRGSIVLPGSPDYDDARLGPPRAQRRAAGAHRSRGRCRRRRAHGARRPRVGPRRCRSAAVATASPATARTTAASSSTWAR